jgi:signal transduction histidine kinase
MFDDSEEPVEPVPILLADDRPEDLQVLRAVLGSPRHHLVAATSGDEALRHLLERDFAAVVLDILMPGMDGFELAAMIRSRKRSAQTPILFLSGVGSDAESLHRAYALGAVDYLVKPVDPDVLRAKVAVFVQLFEKDRRIHAQSRALLDAERRNRELELEQVKLAGLRRYCNLADALPTLVWTADPQARPTYVNRRWVEVTGLGADHGWLEAIHPEEVARCGSLWDEARASGRSFEIVCRLRDAAGSYRWYLARVLPELDGDERHGWIGTFTDLDDLLRAHQEAERAIRVRDEFLSIASHELRTPLSALLVQLGSLERTLLDDTLAPGSRIDRSERKLSAALRHLGRLTKLVDDLLDIARFGSDRVALELEEMNLADVVRDVAERFIDEARQAGCELAVDTPHRAVGHWDRVRVEQVVTNLLSNALKYGRGHPIEVTVAAGADGAHLFVRDHGIGIASSDQQRIFDRFERAVPVKHYGGLGLGLYITRTIVQAHGGDIRVDSEPGAGATFVVDLPLRGQA